MAAPTRTLDTWQAVVGLLAAIAGLYVATKHTPKPETTTAPIGPAGFGEVAGGGGGGGFSPASSVLPTGGTPAPPRGGEQTPTAGNETARGPNGPIGKLVPKVVPQPRPGESQNEYEQRRRETALPGVTGSRVTA